MSPRGGRLVESEPRRAHVELRVLALSAALLVFAGTLHSLIDNRGDVLDGAPFELNWIVLAAAFAATEVIAVHMESKGEAHALTFSEIPYVAGLLLASPDDLLIGRLVG